MSCSECPDPRGKSCHCAACHETFSTIRLFDNHHSVNYGQRPPVSCKDPESIGLVLDAWGTWRTPENLMVTTARVSAMNTSKHAKRSEAQSG